MPCHDKKLEASRRDFVRSDSKKDVDMVVTTAELLRLLREEIMRQQQREDEAAAIAIAVCQTCSAVCPRLPCNPWSASRT